MNYPSDKNKAKPVADKIASYLIYIQVGGEQGDWQCRNVDYMICNGINEDEAVKEWANKVGLNFKDCHKLEKVNTWSWKGRPIRVVQLHEYWNYGKDSWKLLKWI